MPGDRLGGVDRGARIVAPQVDLSSEEFGAYVIAIDVNRSGAHASIVTGSGEAWIAPLNGGGKAAAVRTAFDAAMVLSQVPDVAGDGFLIGLDDGTARRIQPDGTEEKFTLGTDRWVENLTAAPSRGLFACSLGRRVLVVDTAGETVARWDDHASTPAGLCFSPDGGLVAVARYNGVTVWDVETGRQAHDLFWRGSHTGVSWSKDGAFIVTATQDRDLHCWSVADGKDYRMSGYPSKIRDLSWSWDSQYVCASGADAVTAWYCGGGGPAGRPPIELGYAYDSTVARVSCHPSELMVAAGYSNGTVLIGDITNGEALIAKPSGGGAATALDWSPDGATLVAGTETGTAAIMRVEPSKRPGSVSSP